MFSYLCRSDTLEITYIYTYLLFKGLGNKAAQFHQAGIDTVPATLLDDLLEQVELKT